MLTDAKIQERAATSSSYVKGCQYYRNGNVKDIKYSQHEQAYRAQVVGSEVYTVRVNFNNYQEVDGYECDCLAFSSYYHGMCKHIVAVLKVMQAHWEIYFGEGKTNILTHATQELLDFFNHDMLETSQYQQSIPIRIIPTYGFSLESRGKRSWLEFSLGNEKLYVMKNIPQLLDALDIQEEIVYGKNFILKPREAMFDEQAKSLLHLLQSAYADDKQLADWNPYTSSVSAFGDARRLKLTNSNMLKFFTIMEEVPFSVEINHEKVFGVRIVKERPVVNLSVKVVVGGLKLRMETGNDVFYGLDTDFQYIYHQKTIYKVDSLFASCIKPLMKCFYENKKSEVYIPEAEAANFFSSVVPALENIGTVHISSTLLKKFHKEPLEIEIYFDRFTDGIRARVGFKYGDLTIDPLAPSEGTLNTISGKMLLRSKKEENRILTLFQRYGFAIREGQLVQADEEKTYDFLQEGLHQLQNVAEVFYSDDFKNSRITYTGRVSAGVKLNTKTDMLEFSLYYEDMQPSELFALLASYKLKKRYHRLENGAFIPLDSTDLQIVNTLLEQLELNPADIENKGIELPKYRAMYINSLARESSDFHLGRDHSFKKMVQDILEPQDVEYAIPEGIQGKLRDYQKVGFKWLKSLASYGFGGILADDMGLGKTLQVITFLMSEKESENIPSLVIAPTSLVYNWQQEVERFAPALKVMIISGNQEERQEQLNHIDEVDLAVTSYALMKRDIEFYESRIFKYCFIDEAQHIKNPNTLNAKSVKKIRAKGYFALTGTPIENTLTELWSIFDFIMPGYLKTHKSFSNQFEIPISKNREEEALTELGRYIKPFILRRMKKAVLKELPEKIESRMVNEMTEEQAKLYAAWILQVKTEFENEVQNHGFAKSQIKILSLLTRLRQLCCHPSLFIEDYHGGSGKLEMLTELLEDAVSGGHRILLFSQFTGMLAIIKNELESRNIGYYYLDGSTKAEERIKLVNSFNGGEKDVFLISLKAGGTGLNLTGADMVIHYDPWWNPAVEEQATDRAYRIGQKNSVQVCKLITKNTIEEKIYALQQKKREMIDALIQPGENFLAKMSEEEIRKLFEA
ncbi:SNF2 helicase associated domain-containing protein [Pelosinus baikalensis]|uniref:DEAD/DEAH box helicase n=1 Tax=Pelosinus baikalensis TaxID=2892015 RepID=A0ABS8HRW6_9FIRM|nr:DEAD/DEAH box helicase [Pelosinus baikalensis]